MVFFENMYEGEMTLQDLESQQCCGQKTMLSHGLKYSSQATTLDPSAQMMTNKQIFLPMSPTTSPVLVNTVSDRPNKSMQNASPNEELPFDHHEPLFAEPFWALPIPVWEPALQVNKVPPFSSKASTELMANGDIYSKIEIKQEGQHQHRPQEPYTGFQTYLKQPSLVVAALSNEDWHSKHPQSSNVPFPTTSAINTASRAIAPAAPVHGPNQPMRHRPLHQQTRVSDGHQGFKPIRSDKSDPLKPACTLLNGAHTHGSPLVKVQHTEKAMPWLQSSNQFVATVFTSQKIRSGAVEPEMRCPYCHKSFERIHNLRSHLKSHSSEKPFVCDICSISFRRNHDLTRHKRAHTGLKPYACKDCGKTFSRSFSLNRHYTRQTSGCTPPEGFGEGSCVSE